MMSESSSVCYEYDARFLDQKCVSECYESKFPFEKGLLIKVDIDLLYITLTKIRTLDGQIVNVSDHGRVTSQVMVSMTLWPTVLDDRESCEHCVLSELSQYVIDSPSRDQLALYITSYAFNQIMANESTDGEASMFTILGDFKVIREEVFDESEFLTRSDKNEAHSFSCAICLEEEKAGESEYVQTPCSHHFHYTCLHPWFLQTNSCPLCRSIVFH